MQKAKYWTKFWKNCKTSEGNKSKSANYYFANKSNAQKLKFETEKKIELKFDLFEEKNEYEKMEKDVIKGILKNEKLLLRKEGIQYK